jgi:hypothetical protein
MMKVPRVSVGWPVHSDVCSHLVFLMNWMVNDKIFI